MDRFGGSSRGWIWWPADAAERHLAVNRPVRIRIADSDAVRSVGVPNVKDPLSPVAFWHTAIAGCREKLTSMSFSSRSHATAARALAALRLIRGEEWRCVTHRLCRHLRTRLRACAGDAFTFFAGGICRDPSACASIARRIWPG